MQSSISLHNSTTGHIHLFPSHSSKGSSEQMISESRRLLEDKQHTKVKAINTKQIAHGRGSLWCQEEYEL